MIKYDVIIIGAGCSGLSLAYRLLNTNKKVCVIEKFSKSKRVPKTWSYWNVYDHPFKNLEINRLSELFVRNDSMVKINCANNTYNSIDSLDFDKYIFDKISDSENIDILFDTNITNLEHTGVDIRIDTEDNVFRTTYVFDSRPHKQQYSMYQVFLGYKISNANKDIPAILMDFQKSDDFNFVYVVPFSNDTILFETTYFTSNRYKADEMRDELDSYIKESVGGEYTKVSEEYGIIPMTSRQTESQYRTNWYKLGIPSGATRGSTGYTFINIQKQCDYYFNIINGKSVSNPLDTFKRRILRYMDGIILQIINDKPVEASKIIHRMFQKNNSVTLIKFLSDIPSFFDIIRIISNMPKMIFIKYAIVSFFRKKI